jgi:hypothetical protein
MVRLNKRLSEEKYPNISLAQCGLLFLSTPHYRTSQGDWNELLLGFAEYAFGLRGKAIIGPLSSFNNDGVASNENWEDLKTQPPFYFLCEKNATRVLGRMRVVSTQRNQ